MTTAINIINHPQVEKSLLTVFKNNAVATHAFCLEIRHLVERTPKLARCKAESFKKAILTAATLNLSFARQELHLLPFGQEVILHIGYQGCCQLAYRSGQVEMIQANTVHAEDEFSYTQGSNATLEHTPKGQRSKEYTHVYAILYLKSGRAFHHVISREEIERDHKGNNPIWRSHPLQMAKKTALIQIMKTGPVAFPDLAAYDEQSAEPININPKPPISTNEMLGFEAA